MSLITNTSNSILKSVLHKLGDGQQRCMLVDSSNAEIGTAANPMEINATGVTLEVNLDNANDDVQIFGTTGAANTAIITDVAGHLQIDVLSSALPTGAATSALQLADGHNVTVDNAAAGAAVNIQDGGNSITIDGDIGTVTTVTAVTAITNALPAGEGHLGALGTSTGNFKNTIAVTAAGAYVAGDCLGTLGTLTNAVRVSGGSAILQSIHVKDLSNQSPVIIILFFDSDPSGDAGIAVTDAGAFAYGTGTYARQVGKVNIAAADYDTINTNASASVTNIGQQMTGNGTANLYYIAIAGGAPNFAVNNDLEIDFEFLQS